MALDNVHMNCVDENIKMCEKKMNNCHILFRVGKVIPITVGPFVTLWKRIGK